MYEKAIAQSEKWAPLDPRRRVSTLTDFLRYLAAGNRMEAIKIVDQLDDTQSYTKALGYALLEEKDQTIEWFQKGLDENQYMVLFNVFPPFAPLRDDPRFHDLLLRMNLEP